MIVYRVVTLAPPTHHGTREAAAKHAKAVGARYVEQRDIDVSKEGLLQLLNAGQPGTLKARWAVSKRGGLTEVIDGAPDSQLSIGAEGAQYSDEPVTPTADNPFGLPPNPVPLPIDPKAQAEMDTWRAAHQHPKWPPESKGGK